MKKKLLYYLNSLIPVLGDDVFILENENGTQSLQSYVVDCFLDKFSGKQTSIYTKEEIEKMKKEGYYGISMLRRALGTLSDFDFHYASFIHEVKDRIRLHPSILDYIQTIRPHLIITTSPFDILDSFLTEYNSCWFDPDTGDNFKDISNPTICHIFGQSGAYGVKWVMGEEELLEFLHAWNNSNSLSSNFLARFKGQGMLVLGCDALPDWIFRFLWYPLGKNTEGKGKGFLLGNKHEYDNSLEEEVLFKKNMSFMEFLERINYEKSEQMYLLLDAVLKDVKSQYSGRCSQTHDFFISYASEDLKLVCKIKDSLTNMGFDVWLDKERPQELDGKYWTGLEQAIANSRYIIPVITKNYIQRFFGKKRVVENVVSALEEETRRFIETLDRKYADEDKMLSRIIPVIRYGDTAKVWLRNKEVDKDVTIDNINNWSEMGNPCFWIFNDINFKIYSETNPELDTFHTFDWTIYKKR